MFDPNLVLNVSFSERREYTTTREVQRTYKVDRTTVTVGVPSMLAMSMIPASLAASASTRVSSDYSTATPTAGGRLCLSTTDARDSTTLVSCCAAPGTASSVAGRGLILLSTAVPPSPRCPHHLDQQGPKRGCLATT
jgi:hypothetical protein